MAVDTRNNTNSIDAHTSTLKRAREPRMAKKIDNRESKKPKIHDEKKETINNRSLSLFLTET